MTQTKTANLPIPLDRDGKEVSEIVLRKPFAGELRGLKLPNVIEMDFDTGQVLIPRISDINEREMLNMEPENLTVLLTTVATFFVSIKEKDLVTP